MNINVKGVVEKVGKVTKPSKNKPEFKKRELWLQIDNETEYPQVICIDFLNDKCDLINKFKKGDDVEVDVNWRGNVTQDESRCFNSMNAWRVKGMASGAEAAEEIPDNEPETDDNELEDPPF